jgi:Lysyl oxidase
VGLDGTGEVPIPLNTRRLTCLVITYALIHVALVHSLSAADQAPGVLITVMMRSTVGIVLDEVPAAMRDTVAASYLQQPDTFWQDRAKRQIEHTIYGLIYRGSRYSTPKGSLPLPPAHLWLVTLAPTGAQRETVQGHDAVLIPYAFTTTILADVESPAQAEPTLSGVGGVWDEPFALPLDPEFLLQRTGLACINETGFPPNTADSENARWLFDHTCAVETPEIAVCHLTEPLPTESCTEALTKYVGRVDTQMHFERRPWDTGLANHVRIGTPTHHGYPDLQVIGSALHDHRIIYRYIPADACAIAEGCVKGAGWRRLLQFTASIKNVGGRALAVGSTEYSSPLRQHNVFEFSACHGHFHFRYYADFTLDAGTGQGTQGDKRAFCVASTQRRFNSETSPLVHPYSCEHQGVEAGWGDDYIAGIECQWIDITDEAVLPGGKSLPLTGVLVRGRPDHRCAGPLAVRADGVHHRDRGAGRPPPVHLHAELGCQQQRLPTRDVDRGRELRDGALHPSAKWSSA